MTFLSKWKAPDAEQIPDFIIAGAMKSGTTTLHHILDQHPDIFLPKGEIGFWDMDDIITHFDFNHYDKAAGKWTYQSMEENHSEMWRWYGNKFSEAGKRVKGEDSTSYMASYRVPDRLAMQDKKIKVIFLLRNPIDRTYSNYYHLLRTGRAIYSFEDTLQYHPESILTRSLYSRHLARYYDLLPAEQILVLRFENLISDPQSTVNRVCKFIDVDPTKINASAVQIHSNPSRLPKSEKLQRLRNRLFRSAGNSRYLSRLPAKKKNSHVSITLRIFDALHRNINPLTQRKPKPMKVATRSFLEHFFEHELLDLAKLASSENQLND